MIVFRVVLLVTVVSIGSMLVRNTTDMLTCMSFGTRCIQDPPGPTR